MIVVGDWAPGKRVVDLLLNDALILANLEGSILPITHEIIPEPKAGPCIFSTNLPSKEMNFVFGLANNHIMDYGLAGLQLTKDFLARNGFQSAGAGKNILEARQPIVVEENDTRIGIISCCEAQFGVARENHAGVAEIGTWIYSTIKYLSQKVDVIVISVHLAIEVAPWPSPRTQELFQSFIDAGASVVHGHHAHIPQGVEEYNNGVIFYGLGNFAVEPDRWRDIPNTLWSLGAKLNYNSSPITSDLMMFEIRDAPKGVICIEESTKDEQSLHASYIEKCNYPLKDKMLLQALWQETALRSYFHYSASYFNFPDATKFGIYKEQNSHTVYNSIKSFINCIRRGEHKKLPSKKGDYLLWHLMFACESHRDSLTTALGVLSGELEDLRTEETRQLADEMMPWSCNVVTV